MELLPKQRLWLVTRGGRSMNDVFVINGKVGVEMYSGVKKEPRFVEIPPESKIKLKVVKKGCNIPRVYNYSRN